MDTHRKRKRPGTTSMKKTVGTTTSSRGELHNSDSRTWSLPVTRRKTGVGLRKLPPQLGGQRCCVACGVRFDNAGGEAEHAKCVACDGEYHLDCVDQPRSHTPAEGWVCGVCSSDTDRLFDRELVRWRGVNPVAAAAVAHLSVSQLLQQHEQHQQQGVVASHSLSTEVVSSVLTRLSTLLDRDGRGGGGTTTTGEQRAPNAVDDIAAAAAGTATHPRVSSPVGWSQKRENAIGTDSVLEWTLKSVEGSGEEGKMKRVIGVDDASDVGDGDGGPDSRPSPRVEEGITPSDKQGSVERLENDGDSDSEGTGTSEGACSSEDGGSFSRSGLLGARRREAVVAQSDSESSFQNLRGGSDGGDCSGGAAKLWTVEEKDVIVGDESVGNNFGHADGSGDGDGGDIAWLEEAESDTGSAALNALRCIGINSNSSGSIPSTASSNNHASTHGGTVIVENVDSDPGKSAWEAAVVRGRREEDGEGKEEEGNRKLPCLWDKNENNRFLQGVKKHGDAWARLAQKHAERWVVVVDDEENGFDSCGNDGMKDDGGDGDTCQDVPRARAGSAGGGTKRRQSKNNGNVRKEFPQKRKGKAKKASGNRPHDWDQDEHQRFIEGFKQHGNSWVQVAQVVHTRDESQVKRYATHWVDDGGNLRDNFLKTGGWDDDEHERFLKGVRLYGRSWTKVAKVVGTRTNKQVIMHARFRLNKDVSVKENGQQQPVPLRGSV